ncbi:MAG: AAA family ATPase [Desulfovibrio sp.]|nr:AAA family ATPase [Desulfovibrio sp.]
MSTAPVYESQLEAAQAAFLASCPAQEQAAPQEQAPDREFSFLTAEEVLALKTPPWRVKDVLPAAGLAAIFGQPGSGKTFIALDMAFSLAEGREWFQMQTHPCPVVYVNLESNLGLKKRLTAWQKERARPVPDNVRFVIEPFYILEDVAALARGIEPGAVVFLDTLNAASAGLDENSSRDMGLILEAAKKLQRLSEGLVVLIHHGGKDAAKGLRGHSSLNAALDAAIEVTRNGESRFWRTSKAKEAEDGRRQGFRLKSVVIGYTEENEPESSCVVEPDDTPVQEEERLTPALVYGLESLKRALEEENADAVHLEAWRKYFYAGHTADNTNAKKVAFLRVRKELTSLGKIAVLDDLYSLPGTSVQTGTRPVHVPPPVSLNSVQTGTHPFRGVPVVPGSDGDMAVPSSVPVGQETGRQTGDRQETSGGKPHA